MLQKYACRAQDSGHRDQPCCRGAHALLCCRNLMSGGEPCRLHAAAAGVQWQPLGPAWLSRVPCSSGHHRARGCPSSSARSTCTPGQAFDVQHTSGSACRWCICGIVGGRWCCWASMHQCICAPSCGKGWKPVPGHSLRHRACSWAPPLLARGEWGLPEPCPAWPSSCSPCIRLACSTHAALICPGPHPEQV